jgi:transposase
VELVLKTSRGRAWKMQEKLLRVTERTIIVGVDIAKKEHWARITDYRGVDLCKPIKVLNNEESFDRLMARVEVLRQKHRYEQVMVGMEPSGHYWKPFGWYLCLHQSSPVVVGVNPYHTKQAKELDDNSPTKSDKKDALTIAHLVRDGRYFDVYLPEGAYAELRVLTNERKRLQKQVCRARNTIIALMDEYFPEYDEVWEDVTGQTSRKIIRNLPFPSDILETGERNLTNTLSIFSSGTEGKVRAARLIEAASKSIGVVEGRNSVKLRLRNLLDELEVYERKVEAIEQAMETVMDDMEMGELLQSMKGVGPIISAVFLGEVGDVSRFSNWKQVRKLAGLNLIENSSGQHKGKTKVSKRGRPYLRWILFFAGKTTCLHNEQMRDCFRYFRQRKQNPLTGYQAYVAVGLKVMRILFHMAKNRVPYDPDKALGTVREQQIAALI